MLAGCRTPQPSLETVQRSQPLLGTFVTITAHGLDRESLQASITAAFDEFHRVDRLLSIHRPDSEVSRVNSLSGTGPVTVSEEFREMLAGALAVSRATEGAFDVTIGPVTQLWGFIWKDHRLPTADELNRVLPLVGHEKAVLRPDGLVELARSGMMLDFGGIGKGMAVDRAIEVLRERGVQSAMVKAGGDLRVLGLPPGQRHWLVQLEDPAKERRRKMVKLFSGALSTSGNYENYFEVSGQRYSHIIDPRTGLPIQGIASCTVLAPTCAESDALATAFFVMGIGPALCRHGAAKAVRFVTEDLQTVESRRFVEMQGSSR